MSREVERSRGREVLGDPSLPTPTANKLSVGDPGRWDDGWSWEYGEGRRYGERRYKSAAPSRCHYHAAGCRIHTLGQGVVK